MADVKRQRNTPAWISASGTLIMGGLALLAVASEPSDEKLEDHEERIRALEQVTQEKLSRIETRQETMLRAINRLRDDGESP